MKYIVPLIVASFMLAIATAMLEDGPLTLPFLAGYLLGIVVPVVVFSGILTLAVAGAYRLITGKEIQNLFAAMWGIWVLVAAVNFFGNYQNQKNRQAEQALLTEAGPGTPSATLTLQTRFLKNSRQLDEEVARKVATIPIPPLFDPEFLKDKSNFPVAADQLENYGQLFQEYKENRMAMLSQMKSEIEQLDLPQNEKLQAVQEFKNTYELDEALSRKYFDIVIEVSRQSIAYLDFLNQAHYKVSKGQVMFETDTDSDKYQAFMQIFKRLSEQEITTQRELADSREKRMRHLQELSH